jgi:hypothetical protein
VTGGGTDGRIDFDNTDDGHGTAMATLMVGQGGRSGIVGVAPKARLLPIRLEDSRLITQLPSAIRYGVDHGAKVLEIPMGSVWASSSGPCPVEVMDSVAYALQHDVVIIAPAGNSGDLLNRQEYPSSCPGVVAVGALDGVNPWSKTQRQDYVAVAAPGTQIGYVGKTGKYFKDSDGTSQASALTAAGVALVRAHNPQMTGRQVVQRVLARARDVGPTGWDNQTGYGIIRINGAMDTHITVSEDAPNPVYDRFDKWAAQHGQPTAPGGKPVKSSSVPAAKGAQKKSGGGSGVLIVVGVIVLALAAGVGVLVLRRRRPAAGQVPAHTGPVSPSPFGGQPSYPRNDSPPAPHPGARPDFLPPAGAPSRGDTHFGSPSGGQSEEPPRQ